MIGDVIDIIKRKWYLFLISFVISLFAFTGSLMVIYVTSGMLTELLGLKGDSMFMGLIVWFIGILVGGSSFSFFTTLPFRPIYTEIRQECGEEIGRSVQKIVFLFVLLFFSIPQLFGVIARLLKGM